MAISTQISRLMSLRDAIRTKMISLGILPAASSSATLSQCYDALSGVTALSAMSYTPTTTSQVVSSGQYLSGPLTIEAIPSAYIIPSGTITLSSSGTFDVGSYASADVTVTGGPSRPYVEYSHGGSEIYRKSAYLHNFSFVYSNIAPYTSYVSVNDASIITGIGSSAFYNCDSVYFDSSCPNCSEIRSYAFYSSGNPLLINRYLNLLFPNVTYVGDCAFGAGSNALGLSNKQWSNGILGFSKCTYIGNSAFKYCYWGGTHASFPMATTIGAYAFHDCRSMIDGYFPNCETIGPYAFYSCSRYRIASFPACTSIGEHAFFVLSLEAISFPQLSSSPGTLAFGWVKLLSEVEFSKLESFANSGVFESCASLTKVSFPLLNTIAGGSHFNRCTLLSDVYMPQLQSITAQSAFMSCSALESITFQNLVTLTGANAFNSCIGLSAVSLPNLQVLSGTSVFQYCTNLREITLPNWNYTSLTSYAFQRCEKLSSISFPKLSRLSGSAMFRSCFNLVSVFLTGSSLCALGNTVASMFGSTPVSTYSTSAGRFASIFVPSSLLASYKAATNWTTISSKIFAYEDYFDAQGNPL